MYRTPDAPYAAISCFRADDALRCAAMIQEKHPEYDTFYAAPGFLTYPACIIGYRA